MNKKTLLALLGISSLALAASPFDFSKAEPFKLEAETKAIVGNVIEKEFNIKTTTFAHENRLTVDLYEFAKVTGKVAYGAGMGQAQLIADKTGAEVELNFKEYGKFDTAMYASKDFTAGYEYSTKVNKVKVTADARYDLSGEFKQHEVTLGAKSEYMVNDKLDASAKVKLGYAKTKGVNTHTVKTGVEGTVEYRPTTNLTLGAKASVNPTFTISESKLSSTVITNKLSGDVKYIPVKNLTLKSNAEVEVPVTISKDNNNLSVIATVNGKVESSVAYDITKELHKVDSLVITPALETKFSYSASPVLTITPSVNLKYSILKNLDFTSKAAAEVKFANDSNNKFGYNSVVPGISAGLKYTW
ncbi:hypothetical protein HP397_04310 [Streptobacillus felis]|uniref:Uncharacterized protein n=1 Tax=Streptobacillus felis TaxID=1384509 RepID=A0A7Z0PGX2_9FUSO|nr:hypothetical protein [Streptobacillus felis]NYV28035.1 hypothetical protein [Streptobacillus felis]